ncbi:hypothetical protein PVAND_010986 [Polypedilum vanderplanki]|uniref:Transcription initiation factor TFIID subunit 6 n=1 Tax=Polypedilum vanderplanki TaxID=319348 RepID=A0A9J6CI72_POLVA|nr:hypothetical protein PVAND_010986 [Polypedilum vanderplanki]
MEDKIKNPEINSQHFGTNLSLESIKIIAESIGIGNLSDSAAKELSDDISYKLKQIVQDAQKFMNHAKRTRLSIADVDHSLKIRNIEPQYGFICKEFIPFRFASGGGRELYFQEEKEVDLNDVMTSTAPKAPLEVTLRAHWLCVDGIQPTIPENPPPLSKDAQIQDSVNPIKKIEKADLKDTSGKPAIKAHKLKTHETVHIKQLAQHELSVEQQFYYKEITEACVGADEARRAEALQSLCCDPGIHEMLPRMCTFIAEGVKINVVQNNLAILIYLMRMVRALLDNPALFLEKYLHELIPSVSTCIVSKQLCQRPEVDNHWALRDFAAKLMAQICKNFNTSTNNLQTRVTRLFSTALQNDKVPLSSLYGAIEGLSELGHEVIKVFIIPRLKFISERVCNMQATDISNTERNAAGHIRALLAKVCAPVLKTMRPSPDIIEDYKRDFGFLGPALHQSVMKARQTPSTTPTASTASSISVPSVTPRITSTPIQRQISQSQPSQKFFVTKAANSPSTSSGNIVKIQQNNPQKIFIQAPKTVFVAANTQEHELEIDDLSHLE